MLYVGTRKPQQCASLAKAQGERCEAENSYHPIWLRQRDDVRTYGPAGRALVRKVFRAIKEIGWFRVPVFSKDVTESFPRVGKPGLSHGNEAAAA